MVTSLQIITLIAERAHLPLKDFTFTPPLLKRLYEKKFLNVILKQGKSMSMYWRLTRKF